MTAALSSTHSARGLTVTELARVLADQGGRVDRESFARVLGVQQDSREVAPGDLFVARKGEHTDGGAFVVRAVECGAVAILAEQNAELPPCSVPVLRVDGVLRAIGRAAEAVYGFPSQKLRLLGVTGTNGKTTTTSLVESALGALGRRPARLGTLGFAFAGQVDSGSHTTPEADRISRRLAEVVAGGGTHFVMEVSSHALELERVSALCFAVAAFSNLTQDHLDFHGSMPKYAAAKARLFGEELAPRASVFNVDDDFGRKLHAQARGDVLSVSRRGAADVRVQQARLDLSGIIAEIEVLGRPVRLASRLVGAHNLDNLLLALGMLVAAGEEAEPAASALAASPGVPGRLERVDEPADERLVVVDYAHTPDALSRALEALRPLTPGRLLCVFGCGGDRDPKKRRLMGQAVAEGADFAVVTSDNPRSESPDAIAAAITPALAAHGAEYVLELDRARAIDLAVRESRPGDTLLIAGKGHEDYQIIGAERRPFDDRVEARQALARRREEAAR
jgi:UDP-N-acetylmuramoyl-L-alanyl-D-glutamate--2,6-diaminopimelate ligase